MGGHFDLENKKNKITELEEITKKEDFWQDIDNANKTNKELSSLRKIVENYENISKNIVDNLELINIITEDELNFIKDDLSTMENKINELEINTLLNEEFDSANCYLEIHPGAGGTESCDWASMLLRMYKMYCEKKDFSYVVVDEQKGDEAGIKSVTMLIKGPFAYGYLKNETGIHRLVRISPFDAGKRRHTSFASVTVTPEIDQKVNLEIKESDLKIDVYHSSGAGGQSVNTSNSAVRITHIPTKTVVTCQNERSQLNNKEQAMKLLKSKLYQIELAKQDEAMQKIKGTNQSINFGSQIRNYVLEPYKQIKDLRSEYTTSNTDKFLNGDIEEAIESLLRKGKNNEKTN